MKRLICLILVLLTAGCGGSDSGITVQSVEPKQAIKWRMVTTWPKNLPGLTRAKKLQKRAARVGFDWKDKQKVFLKLEEEISELKIENDNNSIEGISEELGDVIFTLVNLCRHYDIEPEDIIRRSNLKFETRFRKMETSSKNQGKKRKFLLQDLLPVLDL